jgi:hypothetical protein
VLHSLCEKQVFIWQPLGGQYCISVQKQGALHLEVKLMIVGGIHLLEPKKRMDRCLVVAPF